MHAMVTTLLSLVVHWHKTLHTCIKHAFPSVLNSRNTLRTNLWKPADHSFTNVSPLPSSSFSKADLRVYFLYFRRHRISVPGEARQPTPLDYRDLPSFPAPREISPWELRGRLGLDQLGFPESGFPRPCWSPALVPVVISSRAFLWGVSDGIFFFASSNSGRSCVSNRLQYNCSVNNRTPHVDYFCSCMYLFLIQYGYFTEENIHLQRLKRLESTAEDLISEPCNAGTITYNF